MGTKRIWEVGSALALLVALGGAGSNVYLNRQRQLQKQRSQPHVFTLYEAVSMNNEALTLRLLATTRPDVNAPTPTGGTYLSLAIRGRCPRNAEALLAYGAKPNAPDEYGQPPLLQSISYGQRSLAKNLLARGARVDGTNGEGRTALMAAAGFDSTTQLLRLLLKSGADLKRKDAAGRTALQFAREHENLAALPLLKKRLGVRTPTLSPVNRHRYALKPFNGPLLVRWTQGGQAVLGKGNQVLSRFTHSNHEGDPLSRIARPRGYIFDFGQHQLLRNGKPIADLFLGHDLRDDAHWGGRPVANGIRYHHGNGGVDVELEALQRESSSSVMVLVTWRAVGPSTYTGLARQLIRIRTRSRPEMEVLVTINPGTEEEYRGRNPFFLWNGKILVQQDHQLHQVVPVRTARRKATPPA